ncbi:hypothetical protein Taro_002187 [Colocasia esculenta]|uniref:Uncharacterized protein n=1 Tax=Colocasia esculenta TaxID=4460 RepID=A0A843TIG4_COLES|nr:hypothetical protein [Colocasia esculenta]
MLRKPVSSPPVVGGAASEGRHGLSSGNGRGKGFGRRSLLSFLFASSTTAAALSEVDDSQKALLQKYLEKSKANKAKNDKEVELLPSSQLIRSVHQNRWSQTSYRADDGWSFFFFYSQRLDSYYKRNYKDYFDFVEGANRGKSDELLSESDKGIRRWLENNR